MYSLKIFIVSVVSQNVTRKPAFARDNAASDWYFAFSFFSGRRSFAPISVVDRRFYFDREKRRDEDRRVQSWRFFTLSLIRKLENLSK